MRAVLYAAAGAPLLIMGIVSLPEGAAAGSAASAGNVTVALAGGMLCAFAILVQPARTLLGRAGSRSARAGGGERAAAPYPQQGPNRTDFTPLAFLGRTVFDDLACAILVAAAFGAATPEREATVWLMLCLGLIIGYLTWRHRSPSPAVQLPVSLGIPLLVAALAMSVNDSPRGMLIAFSLLPATVLGERLAALVELAAGRRPKVLQAAWRGVRAVQGAAHPRAIRFDVRGLGRAVSRAEARDLAARLPATSLLVRARLTKAVFVIGAPVIAIVLIAAYSDEDYTTGPDAGSQIVGMTAVFSLLILGYAVIGVFGFRASRQATSPAEHARLAGFAADNGFEYAPGPAGDGAGSEVTRVMTTPSGRRWMLANAVKTVEQPGGSAAPVTQFSGVCEFAMATRFPHLLLVSRRPRLPTFSSYRSPDRRQRLSLEGGFDRHFDCYSPRGYETDALYLFTPDVMARLIDGVRGFDVEFIDDRLILRTRGDMVTLDPGVWQSIAIAVNALNDRALQWERWRDDRLGDRDGVPRLLTDRPTGVALAGRRLRAGASLGLGLAVAYALVYGVLTWVANSL